MQKGIKLYWRLATICDGLPPLGHVSLISCLSQVSQGLVRYTLINANCPALLWHTHASLHISTNIPRRYSILFVVFDVNILINILMYPLHSEYLCIILVRVYQGPGLHCTCLWSQSCYPSNLLSAHSSRTPTAAKCRR